MIDINKPVQASERKGFELLPEGFYVVEIKEVGDWKTTKKTVTVKETNEKIVNCPISNCRIVLEVNDDSKKSYNGTKLYYNITTHPNMEWSIPNFLDAIYLKEAVPTELKDLAIGRKLSVKVRHVERTVEKVDKKTGISVPTKNTYADVQYVKKLKTEEECENLEF